MRKIKNDRDIFAGNIPEMPVGNVTGNDTETRCGENRAAKMLKTGSLLTLQRRFYPMKFNNHTVAWSMGQMPHTAV